MPVSSGPNSVPGPLAASVDGFPEPDKRAVLTPWNRPEKPNSQRSTYEQTHPRGIRSQHGPWTLTPPDEPETCGPVMLLRKEVIQPHLPVRLPCYDFVPIAGPTFDGSPHKGWATGFGCCRLS